MTDERRLELAVHSVKPDEPKATFQYLYIKYRPLVSFLAARYLRDRADIDDVVQETFVHFFNHAKDVRTSVKSYLTATAKHLAFDLNKKNGKDLTFGDVAKELGQNERTVKTKYYRALKKYKKARGDRP